MAVLERVETHGDARRLHVARTAFGRPLYWTSVYRVGGLLVDAGCSAARPAIARFAEGVEAVVCTHAHEDHVGNLEALAAPAWVPEASVADVARGAPRLPLYRRIVWGTHGGARAEAAPGRVEAGGRRLVAVPSPGHSPDHVAWLDEEESALYSGDAYLGKLKAARAVEDIPLQIRTLRALADVDAAELRPAHGAVLSRPRARLLDVAEHFERIGERSRALQARGLSPRRIRKELLGPEPPLAWVSLGAFSAENIVRSLLGTPRRDRR